MTLQGATLLCAGLVVADHLARALRIQLLLAGETPVPSFLVSLACNAVGDAASLVTPLRIGGQPARVLVFRRFGVSPVRSVVALAAEAAVTYPVAALCGAAAFALFAPRWWSTIRAGWHGSGRVMAWVIVSVVAFALIVIALWRRRAVKPASSPPAAAWGAALRATPPRALALGALLSAVNVAARVAILPVLASTLRPAPGTGTSIVGSFVLTYGQLILPTPAGAGAVDYAFVAGAAGDLHGAAHALLIAWRALTVGLPVALGAVAFVVIAVVSRGRRLVAFAPASHTDTP